MYHPGALSSLARRLLPTGWPGLLLVLAVVAVGMASSWGAWSDPVIDFGRELYVPWRLNQGAVLYRDIVSFNGPFSPYAMAAWFSVAPASLLSVWCLNAAILVATLVLLHGLVHRCAGGLAAAVAGISFAAIFAFGGLGPPGMVPQGNYNWMSPYSHELTHGILLSLIAIACSHRFARRLRPGWAAASGLALGAVFLTKAEVFAAAFVAVLLAIAGALWLRRAPLRGAIQAGLAWLGAVLVAPLLAFLLLAQTMPAREALLGTLGTWPHLLVPQHTGLPYFQWGLGIAEPLASAMRILTWLCVYALLVVSAPILLPRRLRASSAWVFLGVGGGFSALWWGGWLGWFASGSPLQWQDLPQPWQLLLAAAAAGLAATVWRRRVSREGEADALLSLVLVLFSLGLLAKMALNVRAYHYGFALAAPAAAIAVALFTTWLPRWAENRGHAGAPLRAAFLGFWAVALVAHATHAHANFAERRVTVGRGADAFRTGARGLPVAGALAWLEQHAAPGDSLTVLPEGSMLNYLARMPSPVPFVQFTPPLLLLYGEDRMLEVLSDSPPDWIVLVHRDDSDYGTRFFGVDYGRELMAWIRARYDGVKQIGARPFVDDGFGIRILRRQEEP